MKHCSVLPGGTTVPPSAALRRAGAALLLPLGLLAAPLRAQHERIASPRKLAALAPEGTFFWLRIQRLRPELPGLVAMVRRWSDRDGPLRGMLPAQALRQVRGALALLGDVRRSGLGIALEALGRGEVGLGVREDAKGRRRVFLVARVGSEREAEKVARTLGGLFQIPFKSEGPLLGFSPHADTFERLHAAVVRIGEGRGPTPRGERILAELPSGSRLSAWVDLTDHGPWSRLSARMRKGPPDAGAAFLAGGLVQALGSSPSMQFRGELGQERIRIVMAVPGMRKRLSAAAEEALALADRGVSLLPALPGTLARFRLSRSLEAFIRHRNELASGRAQRQIAQFLQGLDFLFKGHRVERDLLPELRPGMRGIVTLGSREEQRALPFRLPAGTLEFDYAGRKLSGSLQAATQLAVLAGNNGRRRRGQLPYLVRTRNQDGYKFSMARVSKPKGGRPWPVGAGLMPTTVSGKGRFFYGSSPELIRAVIRAMDEEQESESEAGVLDRVEIRLQTAARAIKQNAGILATRLLLNDGVRLERGERVLNGIAAILERAGRLEFVNRFVGADFESSLSWEPEAGFFDGPEGTVRRGAGKEGK